MSYTTGTAASFDDVKTALIAACVAGGWTDNGSGILTKGVGVFAISADAEYVGVQGYDAIGGNACPVVKARNIVKTIGLVFPVTYHIHVCTNPDEIYCIINYNLDYWCYCSFGISPAPGLSGLGAWTCGSTVSIGANRISIANNGGSNQQYNDFTCPGFFWATGNNTGTYTWTGSNYYCHHGLDKSPGWTSRDDEFSAIPLNENILSRQPNGWNQESILIPIMPAIARADSFFSIGLNIAHARYVNIKYLSDGQIVTLGTDQWKTYPFTKKNADAQTYYDTGSFGWAIRYEAT